jgi:ABC-type branched-subunit amino acid transport system substrate-binding protein
VKYFYLIIYFFLLSCSKESFIRDEVIIIESNQLDQEEQIEEPKIEKESGEKQIVINEIDIEHEEVDISKKIEDPINKIEESINKEEISIKEDKQALFGEVVKIGLLLPLSGDNKKLGKSILNALEMALFETKSNKIQLLFKDSGDTVEKAIEASNQLEEDGVSIIIGPIFSFQASEVRKNISKNIPIFSFTNDQSIKKEGLWALGFSPKQQIKAIFFEMSQHAITDISVIVPQSIYGDIVLQESRKASISRNIKINHIYRYDRTAKDFSEFSKYLNKEIILSDNGLLIVASGKQLKEISSRAQYRGINPKEIKFFGISGWNNHEILGEPALLGGYFVAPQQFSYETFVSRYFQLYDIVPNEISGLGYDILALLSIGLKNSKTNQELLDFLTNAAGFKGIFGFFKIDINGDVYREFVTYEVMERNFVKKRDIMP